MKKLYLNNEQIEAREQLVFHRPYDPQSYRYGGISHFDAMPVTTARRLIDEGLVDPSECQNDSPSIEEFVSFIESTKEPGDWYLHGYVVSPERDDCRVSVEGIGAYCEVDPRDLVNFVLLCRFADELEASPATAPYCWYD